jgi:hypothetical protein
MGDEGMIARLEDYGLIPVEAQGCQTYDNDLSAVRLGIGDGYPEVGLAEAARARH